MRHDRLPFDEIMTLPDGILVTTPLRTAYDPPMETRIRIAIHAAGLPAPVLQHPIGPYRLDMAYPAIPVAVEYDGRDHLTPERAVRDLERQA